MPDDADFASVLVQGNLLGLQNLLEACKSDADAKGYEKEKAAADQQEMREEMRRATSRNALTSEAVLPVIRVRVPYTAALS